MREKNPFRGGGGVASMARFAGEAAPGLVAELALPASVAGRTTRSSRTRATSSGLGSGRALAAAPLAFVGFVGAAPARATGGGAAVTPGVTATGGTATPGGFEGVRLNSGRALVLVGVRPMGTSSNTRPDRGAAGLPVAGVPPGLLVEGTEARPARSPVGAPGGGVDRAAEPGVAGLAGLAGLAAGFASGEADGLGVRLAVVGGAEGGRFSSASSWATAARTSRPASGFRFR